MFVACSLKIASSNARFTRRSTTSFWKSRQTILILRGFDKGRRQTGAPRDQNRATRCGQAQVWATSSHGCGLLHSYTPHSTLYTPLLRCFLRFRKASPLFVPGNKMPPASNPNKVAASTGLGPCLCITKPHKDDVTSVFAMEITNKNGGFLWWPRGILMGYSWNMNRMLVDTLRLSSNMAMSM